MPIYEYECTECGSIEEVLQKFSDKSLSTCRHCKGKLHKLISNSSFHLKGTGWYVTDYAGNSSKSSNSTPETKKTPSQKADTKKTKIDKSASASKNTS